MNLKSVAVVVPQSKGLTGGEGEGEGKKESQTWRVRRGRVKEEWRLFFYSIDLSPDSHWLLLNKEPWEEVG